MKGTINVAVIFLLSLFIFAAPASAKTLDTKTTADPEKVWQITFNSEITNTENIQDYVYIMTDSGERHPVSLKVADDLKTISVQASEPFFIGQTYTLIVTTNVRSMTGKPLKEMVAMPFSLQGNDIRSVQATLNPLVTNVIVQGTVTVAKMTVSINGSSVETPLHIGNNAQFSRGMLGLINGDKLHIRAYNEQGTMLEEQTYQVSNKGD